MRAAFGKPAARSAAVGSRTESVGGGVTTAQRAACSRSESMRQESSQSYAWPLQAARWRAIQGNTRREGPPRRRSPLSTAPVRRSRTETDRIQVESLPERWARTNRDTPRERAVESRRPPDSESGRDRNCLSVRARKDFSSSDANVLFLSCGPFSHDKATLQTDLVDGRTHGDPHDGGAGKSSGTARATRRESPGSTTFSESNNVSPDRLVVRRSSTQAESRSRSIFRWILRATPAARKAESACSESSAGSGSIHVARPL
jgi:hypothetical protein